jgi:hypothetical protein
MRNIAAVAERGGDVARSGHARQRGGVFGRERVTSRRWVVLDDAAHHHRGEPLPHVALIQPCRFGDLGARGGRQPGELVEEAGAVAKADGEHAEGVVQHG